MKLHLGERQQEILLRCRANQTRLASVPEESTFRIGRVALETAAGLIFGVSFGISLYYFVISVAFYPIALCLLLIARAFGSTFPVSASSLIVFEQDLSFGPPVDVLLAILALVCCFYFTRGAIQHGYRVFAWTQFPLSLSVVLVLFYLTLVHHKPLMPFYGQ